MYLFQKKIYEKYENNMKTIEMDVLNMSIHSWINNETGFI